MSIFYTDNNGNYKYYMPLKSRDDSTWPRFAVSTYKNGNDANLRYVFPANDTSYAGIWSSRNALVTYELCARDSGTFCVLDGDTASNVVKVSGGKYYGTNGWHDCDVIMPTFRTTNKVYRGTNYSTYDPYLHVVAPDASTPYVKYRFDNVPSINKCVMEFMDVMMLCCTKKQTTQRVRQLIPWTGYAKEFPTGTPGYGYNQWLREPNVQDDTLDDWYRKVFSLDDTYDVIEFRFNYNESEFWLGSGAGISDVYENDRFDLTPAIAVSNWYSSDYIEILDCFVTMGRFKSIRGTVNQINPITTMNEE